MPGPAGEWLVKFESTKGPDKDIRKTKQVVNLQRQFTATQVAIHGTPWFWGTILGNLSKDWTWR